MPPVFEIYSDKIVITSAGGLPVDMAEEEFYQGFSVPRNREIMRIFKDIHLVEHIGSGIPRILKKYDRSVFNFTANFLRVVFPYPRVVVERNERMGDIINPNNIDKSIGADKVPIGADRMPIKNKQHRKIVEYLLMHEHEYVTNSIIVNLLGIQATRAKVILREMVDQNLLEAQGEKRYRIYLLNRDISRGKA